MPAAENVLIVGGGIAGMTLGVALGHAGIACEIVEIRPEWVEPGTGISLQGPALRALKPLGVLERCIARGFGYSHFTACDAEGNATGTVQLPRLLGPDYPATLGIMRHALHSVLAEELATLGIAVRLGATVESLADNGRAVTAKFTDGADGCYDLVVGADGSNSKIREMLFGAHVQPRYTGQINWRATVRRPPEVDGRFSYFGPTNKSGYNPVSDSEMYIYILQNLPQRPRWEPHELPAIMRGLLGEFGGALGRARDEIVDPDQIICRPVFSLIVPPPWHRDRIVLLGDAVHSSSPQLASGATLAIEDSTILADMLLTGRDLATVLDDFTRRRYERCRMVVTNSERLGEWEKRPGSPDDDTVALVAKSYEALAQPA